jgi:hypothetical protein
MRVRAVVEPLGDGHGIAPGDQVAVVLVPEGPATRAAGSRRWSNC